VLLYPAVIFGSLLVVALCEFCGPRRQREFPALRRRLANIGFWVLNLVLAALLLPPAVFVRSRIEALSGLAFPSWPIADAGLSLAAGFLLLDLMNYLVHRCEHAVPLFWRFHALHHSDPDVDVTTSVRHHPVEYVLASGVYLVAVIVLDVPGFVVMSHGVAVFGMAAIQHGNIRLPSGWSVGCSRCWSRPTCTASITRSKSTRQIPITGPFCRSGTDFLALARGSAARNTNASSLVCVS
jgi:sterol desaturase/sphingolipid hydroxylase (fatty acid hydroxylase superfamily)